MRVVDIVYTLKLGRSDVLIYGNYGFKNIDIDIFV